MVGDADYWKREYEHLFDQINKDARLGRLVRDMLPDSRLHIGSDGEWAYDVTCTHDRKSGFRAHCCKEPEDAIQSAIDYYFP